MKCLRVRELLGPQVEGYEGPVFDQAFFHQSKCSECQGYFRAKDAGADLSPEDWPIKKSGKLWAWGLLLLVSLVIPTLVLIKTQS